MRRLLETRGFDDTHASGGTAWAAAFGALVVMFASVWAYQVTGRKKEWRVVAAYVGVAAGWLCVGMTGAGLAHQSYPDETGESAGWAISWRIATVGVAVAGAMLLPLAAALLFPFRVSLLAPRRLVTSPRALVPLAVALLAALAGAVANLVEPKGGVAGAFLLVGAAVTACAAGVAGCVAWKNGEGAAAARALPIGVAMLFFVVGLAVKAALQDDCDGVSMHDCPLEFKHSAFAYLFILLGVCVLLVGLIPVLWCQRTPIVFVSADNSALASGSSTADSTADSTDDEYVDYDDDGDDDEYADYDDEYRYDDYESQ